MLLTYVSYSRTITFIIKENFKEAGAKVGLRFCRLATFKLPMNTCDIFYNIVYNLREEGNF